jgi:hypothetical protein
MSDEPSQPVNSFLARGERRANLTKSHRRAPRMEKEVAKRLGGKLTPGSGSGAVKGDIRLKGIARIECKCTKNKSFSVTLEMLEKIEAAGAQGAELPIIVIEFLDGLGRKIKEVAVCPTYVLDSLTQ